jgi:hypothetical protein
MQKIIRPLAAVYVTALAILAILVYRASPAPETQEILGIGIGSYRSDAGIAYLSGRRLDCNRTEQAQLYPSICTVEIAGQTLEIHARRNPPTHPHQFGGDCKAFYNGQEWPCSIGSRHVHVNWFAYLEQPLGLDKTELDALRRKYSIENLSEQVFITGAIVISIVNMMIAFVATGVKYWKGTRHKVFVILTMVSSGITALIGSALLSIWLTRGLWD